MSSGASLSSAGAGSSSNVSGAPPKHPVPVKRVTWGTLALSLGRSGKEWKRAVKEMDESAMRSSGEIEKHKGSLDEGALRSYKSRKESLQYVRGKLHQFLNKPPSLIPSISTALGRARWGERARYETEDLDFFVRTTTYNKERIWIDECLAAAMKPKADENGSDADNQKISMLEALKKRPSLETFPSLSSANGTPWKEVYKTCKLKGMTADDMPWFAKYPRNRTDALEESLEPIIRWLNHTNSKSCIYWLWQRSVPGKDNVFLHIARRFSEHKVYSLGAALFFSNLKKGRRLTYADVQSGFVPTLAFELCRLLPAMDFYLDEVCRMHSEYVIGRAPHIQIDSLILNCYGQLPPRQKALPILVILNGLDRCTPDAAGSILRCVERCAKSNLPICFMISSEETEFLLAESKNWDISSWVTHGFYDLPPEDPTPSKDTPKNPSPTELPKDP